MTVEVTSNSVTFHDKMVRLQRELGDNFNAYLSKNNFYT